MEHNSYCDTIGEVLLNRKPVDFPLNVNKIDNTVAIRVTITTESPYMFKKNTQVAEFSVVTPEQSEYIKPVDMAIRSMIPEDDPDLAAYLNELLRTNKPFLVPDISNSWQTRGSHPNTDTDPQRINRTQGESKTQSTRWHRIPNQIL